MAGKCRPSLREKTLANVMRSNLSDTDKACVKNVFERFVDVVRCQECIHAELFERNCELNTTAYMHCKLGRGEETRNVWHKYKKYYRDYSVVARDGFCDEGERRTDK